MVHETKKTQIGGNHTYYHNSVVCFCYESDRQKRSLQSSRSTHTINSKLHRKLTVTIPIASLSITIAYTFKRRMTCKKVMQPLKVYYADGTHLIEFNVLKSFPAFSSLFVIFCCGCL